MTTKNIEKSPELVELEFAAMTVLHANPQVPTYEAFKQLFADHLAEAWFLSMDNVQRALLDLDRGEIELPRSLPFVAPPRQTPPAR